VHVRALSLGDVDAVLRIQTACPEAAQWSRADYEQARGWVCCESEEAIGFIVTRQAADEMEILNLAVQPAARRRGAATQLLHAALNAGRAAGASRVFLEVRELNVAAVAFYQRHGFASAGRRAGYYSSPREAAVILRKELPGAGL
jgi:ribosomal-protein-alanine N-acetyltransferase